MKFLITNFGSSKFLDSLKQALSETESEYNFAGISSIFTNKFPYSLEDNVFYFGSVEACKHVFKSTSWKRFFDMELMSCRNYYAAWGDLLLNRHYTMMPLAEVFRRKEELYNTFGKTMSGLTPEIVPIREQAIFIRPDSNDKVFTGQLVFHSWFWRFQEKMALMDMSVHPETLVMVATPQPILSEYRCIVHKGKFALGSKYHTWSDEDSEMLITLDNSVPQDVIDFVNKVPQLYPDLDLYCLDIARLPGDELKVIEMGSVHCAGLYAIDLVKFILLIRKVYDSIC